MKNFSHLVGAGLLALTLAPQAQADQLIVNTGVPSSSSLPLTLSSSQWLAAEITTSQEEIITGIQGYILADAGNPANATFTITVYDNGANNTPDTIDPAVFSQQASYTADGWNGLSGLSLDLQAGSYWVAFEVGPNNDTLQGLMPVSVANSLTTAWYDGISTSGYQLTSGAGNDFGLQVTAAAPVPVPPSLLLFVSGLFAVSRLGKRKTA